MTTETVSSTQDASSLHSLVRPWGSFLSEQLYKWKAGEIECGCRDMAIFVRQIVSEEIEREKTQENRPNVCVSDGPADAHKSPSSAEGPFAACNG